ncbi:hypothetical protein SLS63_013692 [Diaporthe eres]|uniref:Rhodopsin domain-containing protein n=1 Tax=Diaporthe eres TaxID=83184 RepID=A0ABR1NMU1_DIAER
MYLSTYCVSYEFSTKMSNAVKANCVLDIVSDIAITIIPFTLLWNVRIDVQKKLAFIGLFSLTLITIAAAMARAIETEVTKKENAIIVSCLSAFPQLFATSTRKIKPKWTPSETYYQRLRSRMQKRQARFTDPLYDMSSVTMPDRDQKNTSYANSYESHQQVLAPEMGQNNAQCIAVTYPSSTMQNQITQQVEYRVEVGNQVGAVQRWPVEYQHINGPYYAGYPTQQQMR